MLYKYIFVCALGVDPFRVKQILPVYSSESSEKSSSSEEEPTGIADLPFDKEHRLASTFDRLGSLGLAYATDADGKVFITKIMPGSQASKQLQKCARSCASATTGLR